MFKPVNPKVDFVEIEKKILDWWGKSGILKKYLNRNKNSQLKFSFLDGPITANNPMGVHHAWGRTYKDLWQRFFNMKGYKQRFQNGFDNQGLWVEVEVEKELGFKNKKDIEKYGIEKFIEKCKERTLKFAKVQEGQSKRLGYFMDWENSYYTMSEENNYMIWTFLKKCYEKGWLYKGKDSVPWCPRCETAISEHEILTEDYKELVHEAVYFRLKLETTIQRSKTKNEYLLVWTTTPWTIPSNVAVAVDEKCEYALVETKKGDLYWVGKNLVRQTFEKEYKKTIKTVKGKELVGLKYEGPFDNLPAVKQVAEENPKNFHLVIATDQNIMPVSSEEGTGLVHTSPSTGVEDYKLGKKLGLPMILVIGDNADYLPGLSFLSAKNAKKNPRLILDYLREKGWIYKTHNYKHRYPACWRCKTELVWRVADEWYIAMDKKTSDLNKTLRERMIEVAKKIHWIPEFGLDRELDWLKNMHDWLISKKNRYWGLALPIYECSRCGYFEVIGSKEELKQKAVVGWEEFDGHSPHKPFIDEVMIGCKKCGEKVKRINDVGNPWLDAGIVTYSTITKENKGKPLYLSNRSQWKKWFPADFITESFPGQFKNWFYSLIAMSTVLENKPPFKTVLGFATLLGEDGRPMHKSWGNAIEFNEGANKMGVDVMRWMYCRQDPAENMLFGYKKADEVRRRFYLILWNVYKFFVDYVNLDKFKIQNGKDEVTIKNLKLKNILDKWILSRLVWLIDFVEKGLRRYNAKDPAMEIERFVDDLSTWYIRRSRERVWVSSENKEDKNNFYQTLYYILVNLSIVLSPFLPFISEEIYTNLTGKESVHLSCWPKVNLKIFNKNILSDMNLVREITEIGHRVRKEIKIKVRQPLAAATVLLPKNKKFLLTKYLNNYKELILAELNIKKIKIKNNPNDDKIYLSYDTNLTDELIKEGRLRELIRQIQEKRKKMGLKPDKKINLTIPSEFSDQIDYIKKRVLARNISIGRELEI